MNQQITQTDMDYSGNSTSQTGTSRIPSQNQNPDE